MIMVIANIQNVLLISKKRCQCLKCIANIQNALPGTNI